VMRRRKKIIEPARVAGNVPSPSVGTHRCHAVLAIPRGAHEGGSYSDCVGGSGGTTLYLLPGLDVSAAASTVVVPK